MQTANKPNAVQRESKVLNRGCKGEKEDSKRERRKARERGTLCVCVCVCVCE